MILLTSLCCFSQKKEVKWIKKGRNSPEFESLRRRDLAFRPFIPRPPSSPRVDVSGYFTEHRRSKHFSPFAGPVAPFTIGVRHTRRTEISLSQQQNLIASFLLLSTSLSLLFDKIVGEKPRCFLRKILTELDPCPRIEQRNRRTRRFHASRRYSPILTIISFTKGRKKEEIGGLVAWKSCVQSPWIRCSLRVAGSLATVVARNLPDRWSGRPGGDRVALDACDGEAGEGGGWRGGGSKRPPFLVVENPRGFDSLYLLRSSIDQIKLDPGKFSSLRRGERKRWSRDALSRRNEIPFPSLILGWFWPGGEGSEIDQGQGSIPGEGVSLSLSLHGKGDVPVLSVYPLGRISQPGCCCCCIAGSSRA